VATHDAVFKGEQLWRRLGACVDDVLALAGDGS